MIYPDKVYIPVVRGCSVWSVSEIDTAKAKKTPAHIVPGYIQYNGGKTPAHIVPGYIQYNGGLYSACNVFLSDADAWEWIHIFRSYRGKMYTAAEIGSIPEVITK